VPDYTALKLLGIAGVLSYGVARLATKAGVVGYNRYTLVAVPIAGMPKMPRGYRVEPIAPEKLATLEIDATAEEQARRFGQGLTCLAAYNARDEFVGITWVGTAPFEETMVHLRFEVPDMAIWDTGLWIHPDHRLGRAFAALWAGTAEWMAARGRKWSMSWIADYNLPSLLSHRRMQSATVGHITTVRFFRWQYMAQGVPKIVRIDRDAPPIMRMNLPSPALENA